MSSKFFSYFLCFVALFFASVFITGCTEEEDSTQTRVNTASIIDITATSATSGGQIISNGGSDITARGVCWSLTQNPTIADYVTTDGTGSGAFTSLLTELTPNTTYFIRAYATHGAGISYGNEISFTTNTEPVALADVTTLSASNVTSTTAAVGAEVTQNGNGTITARGVCWSTTENPTINDNKTNDGHANGSFTSTLTNLADETTYYVRAYATNGAGTAYGNQITFTTSALKVFVAGNSSTQLGPWTPTYWLDGEPTQLGTGIPYAYGRCVAKSGNDIYVTGFTFDEDTHVATYWKNGDPVYLTTNASEAHGIVISGNDVYISGKEHEDGFYRVKCWKNGVPTTVATSSLVGETSIAVIGNDVYVAAGIYDSEKKKWIAKYWKNGQEVPLANGSSNTHAYCIAVSGNDVYVAGTDDASPDDDPDAPSVAVYWKNGTRVTQSDITKDSEARSIVVTGTDVYVGGREGSTLVYWKNGERVPLLADAEEAVVYSIAVTPGVKVYVAATLKNNQGLRLWKNEELIMNLATANARNIFLY